MASFATLGCLILLGAVPIRGTVELSFDDKFRLLRADDFIYLVDAERLTSEQKGSLDRVGSTVSMRLGPGAIVRAWPTTPETKRRRRLPASFGRDSLSASGSHLRLTGTLIPTASTEDAYIQIGATIFRVHTRELADEARRLLDYLVGRVSVRVPKHAVNFAWNAPGARDEAREPAATASRGAWGRYVVRGNVVEITGTVLPSYDEASLQIQSGDTFFALDSPARNPGEHVSLRIPVSRISMVWVQNDAVLSRELVRTMRDPSNRSNRR